MKSRPGHVKFVLATTDPQRLPATVLSRCLQFNLKRLLPAQIRGQLVTVLTAEGIPFEEPALALLASAADGSMRDGLSLLDQAIAYGGGRVSEQDVRLMLGTRSGELILDLATALADGDGAALLAEIGRIAEVTPDFGGVLSDLIALLHRIALAQQVPEVAADEDPERVRVLDLAQRIPPEDVQLFYQVLLLGQADLPLAPDPRGGLEMVLLRALAFRPVTGSAPAAWRVSARQAVADVAAKSASPPPSPPAPKPEPTASPAAPPAGRSPPAPEGATALALAAPASMLEVAEDWHRLVAQMGLEGLEGQLAQHCAFGGWDGNRLHLVLDPSAATMRVAGAEQRLGATLAEVLERPLSRLTRPSPPAGRDARRGLASPRRRASSRGGAGPCSRTRWRVPCARDSTPNGSAGAFARCDDRAVAVPPRRLPRGPPLRRRGRLRAC